MLLEATCTRPMAISDRRTLSLIPIPVFSASVAPSCTVIVPADALSHIPTAFNVTLLTVNAP
jgi:hypothetical protein